MVLLLPIVEQPLTLGETRAGTPFFTVQSFTWFPEEDWLEEEALQRPSA